MFLHILILLLLLISPPTTAYPYEVCEGGKYIANSEFESNLNLLLSSLSSHNSTYATDVNGSTPNLVYGLFLCRGDISLSECQNCIKNATQSILQLCPYYKEATVWYDTCQIRYSDLSFFTSMDDNHFERDFNATKCNDPDTFNKLLKELLEKLSEQAANYSSLMFATGTASTTTSNKLKIYGMVQCTRDLPNAVCYQCLQESFIDLLQYFGAREGGEFLMKSCNFRYEVYRFFEGEPTISLAIPPSPPPVPFLPPPAPIQEDGRKGNRNVIIISIAINIVIVFLGIFAVRIFFRKTSAQNSHGTANPGEISRTESLYFDLSVLKIATANFSDINKLGQGGFGAVYKGILPHGEDIAVKRLSANSQQGIEELKNELLLIAKLQHRNLVRLQGVCLEEGERLLAYEYMPNGSLDKFLFDLTKRKELNWERRFKIIGGIARGLLYLHEESQLKVIHRDLKSSNVLLDANMKPKISDFGLARLFGGDETHAITCRVVGTFGYMAPEYARHGLFSAKLDVYSYGILVLEIVTGRKNSDFKYDSDHGQCLLSYAWKHWRSGTALEIIDKSLGEDYSRNEVFRCIQIGLLCAQEVPVHRPSMSLVYLMLKSPLMPLQDPLPPAYLVDFSTVGSYFCSTDRSSPSLNQLVQVINPAFSLANTVGILGGVSAVSTLDFLEKLIKWSSEGGEQSLPFIACNDPVINKEIACERSLPPHLSSRSTPYQSNRSLIVDCLRRKRLFLEKSGARCIVMPCHISHVWYDEVSQGCSVPFLHMGECVAEELKATNLKPVEVASKLRIGVLATEAILTSAVYQEQLQNLGFEAVLLDRATMEHTVFPAVEAFTKGDMEGARNLLRIALQVLVRAVSTVILASSEFHQLLPPNDPLLNKCTNPIDALARSTLQWAKSTEEKG